MKKWMLYLITLAIAGMILWSCSGDDDATEPTNPDFYCKITTPTDSSRYSIGIDLEIQIETDEYNITEVQYFVDDNYTGNDQISPYIYTLPTTGYDEGIHTIKVLAKNDLGIEVERQVDVFLTNAVFDEELYYSGIMGLAQNFLAYLNVNTSIDATTVWDIDYFSNRDNWYWEEHIDWDNDTTFCVIDMLYMSMTDTATWYNGSPIPDIITFEQGNITVMEFVHNLPIEQKQLYYEMVGKYHQFSCGWSDYDGYERDPMNEIIYVSDFVINGADTVLVVRPKLKLNDSNAFNFMDYGH